MQTTRGTSLSESAQPAQLNQTTRGGHRLVLVLTVAAIVIALDVVSKIVVVAKLTNHAPIRLLGGAVSLEETRNPGAAFSVGTGTTIVFAVVAIAVIVVILRTARRLASLPWALVLGLLLGGAAGNLIDRLVRSPGVFRGWVVDWISVPHFAVFNLADSAITVGAVLAVLLALSGRQFDGSVHRGPKVAASAAVGDTIDAPGGDTTDELASNVASEPTEEAEL